MSKPVLTAMLRFLRAHPERTGRLLRPHIPSVRKAVSELSKAFGYLADDARCPDLTFHDLKHTSLTNYRLSGMDLSQMQKISGNKTIELLVRRYQKVVDDELIAAVDRAASRSAGKKRSRDRNQRADAE